MVRQGQFSLGYLLLQTFWIALTVCFTRHMFIYATDFTTPVAPDIGMMWSMGANLFCGSVVVGGFFKCMRAGAAVGGAAVFMMLVMLAALWASHAA